MISYFDEASQMPQLFTILHTAHDVLVKYFWSSKRTNVINLFSIRNIKTNMYMFPNKIERLDDDENWIRDLRGRLPSFFLPLVLARKSKMPF